MNIIHQSKHEQPFFPKKFKSLFQVEKTTALVCLPIPLQLHPNENWIHSQEFASPEVDPVDKTA